MQPICEPVDLPLGITALVAQVDWPAGSSPPPRLLHFHDVAEIVLFGDTCGRLFCADKTYPITPGCAVFIPSMTYHDYQFDVGPMRWTLIQVEPYLVDQFAQGAEKGALSRPFCVQPDDVTARRLRFLAEWLAEAARADPAAPLIERILDLILDRLVSLQTTAEDDVVASGSHMLRFLPVIERLRQAPGARLTLSAAATLCHVSPAYFSRRFAAVFGCGFTDYVTAYRLHVASRRIATTAAPVSEIGYELGFSSPSHFTARFRDRFGITPSDYRKRVRLSLAKPSSRIQHEHATSIDSEP